MRINKMGKDILIKLAENDRIIDFKQIIVSDEDFGRRFHENFYDTIRTYVEQAESGKLKQYQITMEVDQR